jgi:dienelactone hydrolase
MRRLLHLVCLLVLISGRAYADGDLLPGLVHEATFLPITLPNGSEARLEAAILRPQGPGRFPLVVLVHGTPRRLDDIEHMSPEAYIGVAVAFATRGYAVVSILRRGFGRSSGPYAERYWGTCNNRDYLQVGRISAEDVTGAVAALRREPWVDPGKVVLLGHSTGGFAVTAAAATNPPGVVGILDIAGGRGSDAPDHVCSEDRLVSDVKVFGETARVPALWVYAENDHFFGPDLARRMLAAYAAGGAPAQLTMLPPIGADGHAALQMAPDDVIGPAVEAFLASLGLPTKVTMALPPPPPLPEPAGLNRGCALSFLAYVAARLEAKAFAINPEGHCGFRIGAHSADEARQAALDACLSRATDCRVYAVGQSLAAH